MSETKQVTGVVKFDNQRPFGNKTLYSIKLADDNNLYRIGEEGYGEITTVGNTVTVTYEEKVTNGKTVYNVTNIVKATPKQAPAKGGGKNYSGGGNSGNVDWAAKDAAIQYQSARKDAIEVLNTLLAHDAFKLGAKTKVQENYVAYMSMLDKLTAEFYQDIATQAAVARNTEALKASDPFEEDESPEYEDD